MSSTPRTTAVPRLTPGLRIEPAEGGAEHRLIRPDGKAVRLPNRLVAVLLECDGERTSWDIAARLSGHPATPPVQPELVEKLATQLSPHGITEPGERPVRPEVHAAVVGGTLRFACQMCARSCEGHTIGPLSPERATQIERDHARLAERFPALAAHTPLRRLQRGDEAIVALNVVDGRCVFLDETRHCMLHAHIGPEAKPRICQRFPLQAVEVEDAVRVGVQPSCYRLHRVFESAEPADRVDVAALAADPFGTRPPAGGSTTSSAEHAQARAEESRILGWLGEPDMGLAELWFRLAGAPPAARARQRLPQDFFVALSRVFARLPGRLDVDLDAHSDARLDTGHARSVHALVQGVGQLAARDDAGALCELALPAGHWRFVRFVLEQGLFLREAGRHLPPTFAAVALALGATAACWLAPPSQGREIGEDDAFGEVIAAFNRTFLQPGMWSALFDSPGELEQVLVTLRRPAAGGSGSAPEPA